jgi:hypothetical protein
MGSATSTIPPNPNCTLAMGLTILLCGKPDVEQYSEWLL